MIVKVVPDGFCPILSLKDVQIQTFDIDIVLTKAVDVSPHIIPGNFRRIGITRME